MNEIDILSPGKILVVDDNPVVADLIVDLLLQKNYEVRIAKSGQETINIAASMQPELILLDIHLPDINGHEVCRQLKSAPATQNIPIIFITGNYNTLDKLQGLEAGAVAYMKKPFNPQEILLIIQNQITNQRLKKQLEKQNEQLKAEISARAAIEERLRILERAVAASQNGIVVTDAQLPDYPIIYVNSGYEQLTGYKASEIIGKNCRFLQGKNIDQPEKAKIKQALATNTECEVLLQNYRKDGTLFWNQLTISPVFDQKDKVTHFIGILTDVSAQIATEIALQERENIYHALVMGIPDLLIRMNSQGTYLDFFPGNEVTLYAPEYSQKGANIYDILPFDKAQQRMSYIQITLETGEQQLYEHQLTINGKIYYEEVRIVPCLEDNVLVIVRNISDRKNADMAVKKSEERLLSALKGTGDGIFDWDIKTGKVIHLQKPQQPLTFQTNDYSEWHDRVHPEDKPKVELALTAHFAGITPQYQAEFRFLGQDGEYQWILARGQAQWDETDQPIRLVGVAQSISERKKFEAKILQQKEFLRTIYQEVDQAIFVVDVLETGEFCFASLNLTQEKLIGRSSKNVKGKTPFEVLPLTQATFAMQNYQTCLILEQAINYEECWKFQGEDTWWITTLKPIRNQEGKIYRLIGISTNITERKQTENALQQNEQKFRAIFNCSFQFIGLLNPDGRVIEINQTGLDFAGITLQDVVNKSFWETYWWQISSETQQQLKQAIARAAQGEFIRYEVSIQGIGGSVATVNFSLQPIFDESGKVKLLMPEGRNISDRKQAEKQLRQSEEKFHNAFEYAAIGMALIGLDGRCLQVNHCFCEITGYTKEELLSMRVQDITHPDDWENELDYVHKLLAAEINHFNLEKRYFHKQGNILWIFLTVSLVRDEYEAPLYYIAQIQNITERKRSEAVLISSEHIVSASTDALCLISRNYTYQLVNRTFLNWHQKENHQIIGHHVSEIVGKEFFESKIKPNIDRCLAGEIVEYEQWYTFPSIGRQFVRVSYAPYRKQGGKIEGIAVSLKNITQLKQTEEALCKSEAMLNTVTSNIPGCLYTVVSHPDNSISFEYISEKCSEIFEVEAEAILANAQLLSEQIHPDDLPTYIEAVTVSKQNLTPFSQEWRHILPSGKILWIFNNSHPQQRDNGEVVWYGVSLDITSRKEIEVQLLEAKQTAETANRAKSAFLANMSHELRSPLNAILGFAQLLNGSQNLTAQQQENLEIIQHSGEHLLNLINDILDLSKIEAGSITINEVEFDLLRMLDELRQMFQLKANKKQLQLHFLISEDIPKYVLGDRLKLRQILINLLSNAIKFTPEGSVTLTGERIADAKVSSKCNLRFAVKDTGVGINPEELSQLFHPFFQTKAGLKSPQGSGLGLSISNKYTQLLGGKLEVDSEVGVGTTFHLEIQLILNTSPNLLESQYLQTNIVGLAKDQPSYRILIVDDRAYNRQLLHQLLASLGFETREAINGQEAIAICQEFQPHLIWMDLKMPIMDGYEATRQIRSWAKAQPSILNPKIIALTASAFNEQKNDALVVGCDDFVVKPLNTKIILDKMAEHLGVRYVFQESITEEVPTDLQSDHTPQELLSVMSSEWQEKLADACLILDSEEIETLIAEIPPNNSTLAKLLHNYAYNFAYDQILRFLRQTEADN